MVSMAKDLELNELSQLSNQNQKVSDWIVFSITFFSFFISGWIFFYSFLFRNYEVHHRSIQFLFSIILSLSCSMYQMIIFEILNIFESYSRTLIMSFSLYSLIFLLIFIVPLYWFHFVISAANATKQSIRVIPLSIICEILFLYLFFHFIQPNDNVNNNIIEAATSRFGVYGVTLMAFLSGFGAVSCPYRWLQYFLQTVDDASIIDLERKVIECMERIITIKKRMLLLNQRIRYHKELTCEESFLIKSIKFIPRLLSTSFDKTMNDRKEIRELKQQLNGSNELHNYLYLNLLQLYEWKKAIKYSKKLRGRIQNMLGYLMVCYCIYKMIMSSINLIFHRKRRLDPITKCFKILATILDINHIINVEFWSQQISFIMIGAIVSTQIRGILIKMMRFFSYITSSIFTSNAIVLFLIELMGMYFISSILLIRMNIPQEYRYFITNIIGPHLQFDFYHEWFDIIFVISGCATIIFLIISVTYRRFHYYDHLVRKTD